MNSGLAGRRGVRQRRFGLEQQDEGLLQLVRLDRCSLSCKGSARLARSASRLKRSVLPPILGVRSARHRDDSHQFNSNHAHPQGRDEDGVSNRAAGTDRRAPPCCWSCRAWQGRGGRHGRRTGSASGRGGRQSGSRRRPRRQGARGPVGKRGGSGIGQQPRSLLSSSGACGAGGSGTGGS